MFAVSMVLQHIDQYQIYERLICDMKNCVCDLKKNTQEQQCVKKKYIYIAKDINIFAEITISIKNNHTLNQISRKTVFSTLYLSSTEDIVPSKFSVPRSTSHSYQYCLHSPPSQPCLLPYPSNSQLPDDMSHKVLS